jgi:hypothetical protein
MTFKFLPIKKIRQFKCSDLIGKIVTISCQHLSDDKKRQYVHASSKDLNEFDIYGVSNWIPVLGEKDTEVKRKVMGAYLMEAMNGGRSDNREYSSYQNYFNKDKKQEVQDYWKGGLLGRMRRQGGDPDRVSIILKFNAFSLEDNTWSMIAPEEWYSELHPIKFPHGFYGSSEEAIKFFGDKAHEDLFGERYFPVIVFPKKTEADIRGIVHGAKGCSKPIVTKDYVVFGTRCKPDEYSYIIEQTYTAGGKVAKSKEWDWD